METKITNEMLAALKAPLPKEAVTQHPTKKYLSSIKPIYIVERLNEVFGLGGWDVTNEFVERTEERWIKAEKNGVEVDKLIPAMVVVKSKFRADEYGIHVEAFGGNDNEDLGDAYKGACSDALSKIGAYIYIGMDVYKGQKPGNAPESPRNAPQSEQGRHPVKTISEPQQKRFFAIAMKSGATTDQVKSLLGKLGYQHSKDISVSDYDKICKLFETGQWADELGDKSLLQPEDAPF